MSEAFPQELDLSEFKQYMQSAYKAGVVDSIEEASKALIDFINNEQNVFEEDYRLGFNAALQILELFKTQAIAELEGKSKADLEEEIERQAREAGVPEVDEVIEADTIIDTDGTILKNIKPVKKNKKDKKKHKKKEE